jgi:hypothetical protein
VKLQPDATVTAVKRPLSPTSTLSDCSDEEKITVSPLSKRVKRNQTADVNPSNASSKVPVANAPIPLEASITAATTQVPNQQKQSPKMSSDGEDFEYEDDTGFDEDVNMDGELREAAVMQSFLHADFPQLPTRQSKVMRSMTTRDTMHLM